MTAKRIAWVKIALLSITVVLTAFMLTACFGTHTVITFESNGGSPCESVTVEEGTESITLPTPTRNGYNFIGWYSDRAMTVSVANVLSGEDIPDSSVTFYAKWEIKKIILTFKAGEETVEIMSVDYDTYISTEDFPSLDNYPGYYWNTPAFRAQYDRTVEAVKNVEENPDYTVTYFIPSENGFEVYAQREGKEGERISVPSDPKPSTQGETQYFSGWYYDENYTEPCTEPPTVIGTQNLSLYAKFEIAGDDSKYLYYEETADGSGIVITGLNVVGGYQSSISVPSQIAGKPVVMIGRKGESPTTKGLLGSEFVKTFVIPETVREIGDWAFAGCTALKEVVFAGDAVTSIGTGAFAGCTALEKINLRDNLTVIGDYAFAGIGTGGDVHLAFDDIPSDWTLKEMSLSAVEFGKDSKLSSIGDYAFYNCNLLQDITLGTVMRDFNYLAFYGSGITNVGFYDGGNLKSIDGAVYSRSGTTLYYYPLHGDEAFSLPAVVTEIAPYAFYGNLVIKSVTASPSLQTIGAGAFAECKSLSYFSAETSSLKTVGENAFGNCSSLTEIAFPATLTDMGDGVFASCTSLRSVAFSGRLLNKIGERAFDGCTALVSFAVPSETVSIGNYAFNGCSALSLLTFGTGSKLTSVGDYAFYECVNLGSVLLPSGLSSIGKYAFASEKGRMEFEFDSDIDLSNITYLGDYAFMNTRIASVTISGKIPSDEALGKYVFKNCTLLQQAYFSPGGYTTVSEGLFYGCTSLTRIRFSGNIRSIGKYAFYNCASMEWVEFGSGVNEIYESAFEGCVKLTNPGGTQRVLPVNLTYLGSRAFYNCKSLASVNIPAGLTEIESETFAGCEALTDINYDAGTTLTTLGENCFAYCASLERAMLPATLALRNEQNSAGFIGNPFYGCGKLKNFVFSGTTDGTLFEENGIIYRKLEKAAVEGEYANERAIYAYPTAKSTATFNVPTNVAVIDDYAFYGSIIRGLTFARNTESGGVENVVLVSIGDYAFAETQITSVTLSYRVYEVGAYAFYNSSLNSFTVESAYIYDGITGYSIINTDTDKSNNIISIGAYALARTDITSVTVPSRVSELGEGALSENYLLSTVNLEGGTLTGLSLGARLFENNNKIKEIVIPSSVTDIGSYAFYRCGNLLSVRFAVGAGNGLNIGDYAFAEAQYLYEITFPSVLVSVGTGVFKGDTRLKYVNFAEELTVADSLEIPDRAFEGMPVLEEITLPAYISRVGEGAFVRSNLEKITFEGDETSVPLEIGKEAFAGLTALNEITLPANLVSIGERAFAESVLASVSYGDGMDFTIGKEAFIGTLIEGFDATDRVVGLGEGCFASAPRFTYFTCTDSIPEIPDRAFYGNAALVSVTLGNGINRLGNESFYGTGITELQSVSVEYIGENAFEMSSVTNVKFTSPGGLEIGTGAFRDAANLLSVQLYAEGEMIIGGEILNGCGALTELTISASAVSLEEGFASGALSLGEGFEFTETDTDKATYIFDEDEKVLYSEGGSRFVYYPAGKVGSTFTLSSAVTSIGNYAFYGNTGLAAIIIEGENVTKEENSFTETGSGLKFYVAENLVDIYRNLWQTSAVEARTTVAGGFVLALQSSGEYSVSEYLGSDGKVVIDGTMSDGNGNAFTVTSIGESAFKNNTVIETVEIGNGIKTISNEAFRNCVNLRSVTIGENVTGIKSYAFYGCTELESVIFEGDSSLISIGNYAFARNTSLSAFTVPSGVESIGIFAFSGDTSLGSVSLYEGLTEIGNNAFENCVSLNSVVLPSSLAKLGSYVFNGCENLVYLDIKNSSVCSIQSNTFGGTPESLYFFVPDDTAARIYKSDSVWRTYISKILSATDRSSESGFENYVLRYDGTGYELAAYLGTEKDVIIESVINDEISIYSIGEYAIGKFAENVVIGEGIKTIDERAFYQASNLAAVTIASTVESIGNYAFAYLKNLVSVTVNEDSKLNSIGNYAFYGSCGLTEFVFPASVRTVGNYAFSCEANGEGMNLERIEFRHDAVSGTDADGESVYIALGAGAFAYNTKLRNITFNCRVSSVGDGAFSGCTALDSIYFNYNPRTATEAVITVSGGGIFGGCEKLTVFLPTDAIKTQITQTWTNSYDLHKLTTVNYTDARGFVYAITSATNRQVTVTNYLGDDTQITFPTETQIGQDMYTVVRIGRERYGTEEELNGYVIGKNVTKVTIPSSVKTIGEDAFRNSESLKEVVMNSGVITIEGYAFAGCKKLTDITIPLSVTTIEAYAFYGCESLNTGLKFAESVAPPSVPTLVIGGYVFAECTSMSSFYVPNHVRLIGGYRTGGSTNTGHTFENCINLKTFTFSDDALITTIEEYTFSNTKIEEITLPQSMETLADYAFANCSELKRIVVGREIGAGISTATSAGNNMFEGISNPQLKIYVPSSTYDVYAANKGWNVKTVIKNNVTPDGMFAYEQDDTGGSYVTLTDYRGTEEIVTIPRIVTLQGRDYYVSAIGKYFGNGKIKKIVFASDSFVTSIADYAFSNCTGLEEIHLPDSITAIGAYAFEGCSSLSDIILPKSLAEIKEFTFYNCIGLKEITLPSEIQSIGPSAFYRCTSLTRVKVEFGKNLNESNVGASLGNSAFGDAGTGAGGLVIIVPDDKYSIFRSGWISVRNNIYSESDVVGDYVVTTNETGTALTLVQYLGAEQEIDLTELTLKGLKIDTILENSIASDKTRIVVDSTIKYPDSMAGIVTIKE